MFAREKATVCQSCGTRAIEWIENRFAYLADVHVCPGCELLDQERQNLPEGQRGAQVFLVKNRPGVETSDGIGQEIYGKEDDGAWPLNA